MTYTTTTQVYPIDKDQPDAQLIALAARAIQAGKLVAFPTETVYGLGADATNAEAVARIFAAKQRPSNDPIIVHIADLTQLEHVAIAIPAIAYQLAAHFWAGALTMVLKRGANIPPNVSAGTDTVAVRMPSHPVAHALITAAGLPIAAPSANTFSRPSATTAQHVLDDLNGRVDVILDGGAAHIGLESTVIDLTGNTPTILRPGGVTLEQLREIIPNLGVKTRYLEAEGEAATSPGELLKHYSPNANLLLYSGEREAVLERMINDAHNEIGQKKRVGILALDEEVQHFEVLTGVEIVALGSREDLAGIGVSLFAKIREIDQHGVDLILIRAVEKDGIGAAIWDRLVRAAEGHIVQV